MDKTIGVFSVIISNDRVLLVKRRDLPLWDLPGGRLEVGESIFDCSIRETREETGYNVKIEKIIGSYINNERNDTQILLLSNIVSGCPITEGPETKQLKFFPLNRLPLNMVPARRRQLAMLKKEKRILRLL
ncbi:putative 8-oxo-dGTP diphosphatase [Enterococcus innesii]|uniref:8-oxo-dGTP diphosphatase n=1 Tax=Enterococcus innesii TaxID=2839759 RepID=A0ABM7XSR8_9ENTE|nr:NUDIX domain-containing protein [Enterococcus innesii]BDG68140.1 putative 8-oxo-dGTP diphosphatase [Enterococcus innesii]